MIMSDKENSVLPATDSKQEDTTQKGSVIDMMLGKDPEKVIENKTLG